MRVVFMGTPAFAERSLQALLDAGHNIAGVVSQPARPAGRGRVPLQPAVALLAEAHGLPLIQPERPHEPAALETLRAWAPDAIVVAAYGRILRPAILDLPPLGCLNVHASLLPRWRGASPIAMAILAGDRETGVTIMLLDRGMDTGPTLARRAIPIDDADTTATLTPKLAELGAGLLAETLPAWAAGAISLQPQDDAAATYCRTFTKEDGRIDWSQPTDAIWRLVRAFDPWPGAFTTWQGQHLKVLEAWPAAWAGPEPAGTVVDVDGTPAAVCGAGALLLRRLQLAGRKPADGPAFMRGQRGFVGSVLG